MKKVIALIFISSLLLSCNINVKKEESKSSKRSLSIKIKGSDTVLPFSEKAANIFSKNKKDQIVSVTGGGSGVGISSLLSGNADVAQSSRKIKFMEFQKAQQNGIEVKELIIGYDALAIIVHIENKVNNLTREELEGIFTGEITNWKEVGGEDLKIVPYSRETSSGTYEFFKEIVLENKNFASGIMSMPANGAVIQSVSQTKGAIAYVGIAYLNSYVKGVSVSFDDGYSYVQPTVDNAKNKSYPIVRPLYYYYLKEKEEQLKVFIDFVISNEGQDIIRSLGFVDLE